MYATATLTPGASAAGRPSQALAVKFAAMLPALQFGYAILLAPILFAAETREILAGFGDPTNGPSTRAAAIAYGLFFVVSVLTFLVARPTVSRTARQLFLAVAALCLYAFLSALWSLDPIRTLMKATQQTMVVMSLLAAVISARDPEPVLKWLIGLMTAVVLVNILAVIARPPGPIGHEGIYAHKNYLGAVTALSLMFGIYALTFRRLVYLIAGLFLIAGSFLLLVASESKTSAGMAVAAPALAIGVYLLAKHVAIPPLVTWLVAQGAAVAGFILLGAIFDFQLSDLLRLAFGDETFTGRTHIWAFSWQKIAEHPIFGYGYHGFWNIGPESPRFTAHIQFIHNMPHAHNGYIDLLLNLGIVGLVFFAVIFALAMGRVMRLDSLGAVLCVFGLANLMNVSLRAYMESEWFMDATAPSETMFLIVACCAAIAPAARRARLPSLSMRR